MRLPRARYRLDGLAGHGLAAHEASRVVWLGAGVVRIAQVAYGGSLMNQANAVMAVTALPLFKRGLKPNHRTLALCLPHIGAKPNLSVRWWLNFGGYCRA